MIVTCVLGSVNRKLPIAKRSNLEQIVSTSRKTFFIRGLGSIFSWWSYHRFSANFFAFLETNFPN